MHKNDFSTPTNGTRLTMNARLLRNVPLLQQKMAVISLSLYPYDDDDELPFNLLINMIIQDTHSFMTHSLG